MKSTVLSGSVGIAVAVAALACQPAAPSDAASRDAASHDVAAHDAGPRDPKYSVQVPNGLAFADFEGYEAWQTIAVSHNGDKLAVILGNPAMIAAYKAGIPGNGQPFPDGARMAKIHWLTEKNDSEPGNPVIPTVQHDVDFMVKDSKKYADGGGWGYGAFEYDPASKTFKPATTADSPPQQNDAKCGAACHTIVKTRDYVFTRYQTR